MRRAVLLVAAIGCGSPATEPQVSRTQVALVPLAENRKVDLLFVIDNSTAFLDTQLALENAFPALVDELSRLDGGLPDLHLGVVTSVERVLGDRVGRFQRLRLRAAPRVRTPRARQQSCECRLPAR